MQKVTSQKIERTCDAGCGVVKTWEFIEMTDETILEMQNWYTVIREIFDGRQFQKIAVQACSLACVPVAAVKLALPKVADEPEIDLASLRDPSVIN